ncbi:MAG: aminotransferase class I/II-fold pyridoxal phosphate-dependent enzyme, partial [Alphaproteobacteria bacterium]|nr:aminotransferase class I/II-fold pyridoxal phosphate-dependent enzyme [Alphaproteobacteria bacterium]
NPMGSWWPAAEVERFIDSVPPTTMIVLDEAYGELAPAGTMPDIDTSRPNLLRMRTFSKAYGMAGVRCGYIIGERQSIRAFERVRDHFGVSSLAQAGALAALEAPEHLTWVLTQTEASKARIAEIAIDNGLLPLPSATNFVAVDCRRDAAFAQAILTGLAERGIFIRKPGTPGLDHCIRISAGLPAAMDLLAEQLPLAIAAAMNPPAG